MHWRKEMKRNPKSSQAKTRCMTLLKQKKMYESQLNMMDNQAFNMDQIQFAQETVESTIVTVQAMKQTGAALKEQFKAPEMDLDAIMDIQDDLTELMEESQE